MCGTRTSQLPLRRCLISVRYAFTNCVHSSTTLCGRNLRHVGTAFGLRVLEWHFKAFGFENFLGGGMPPDPPRDSCLRRSQVFSVAFFLHDFNYPVVRHSALCIFGTCLAYHSNILENQVLGPDSTGINLNKDRLQYVLIREDTKFSPFVQIRAKATVQNSRYPKTVLNHDKVRLRFIS